MKTLYLFLAIVFFGACSPKVSYHFGHNRYIEEFHTHIFNSSLELYFKTPADIIYTTNSQELKRIIRSNKIKPRDSVLVYGKTDYPPYDFFVTVSEENLQNYPQTFIVLDTVINSIMIRFIGNPLGENSTRALRTDLNNIFASIVTGPSYKKEIVTMFDIVNKYNTSNKFFAATNEISLFPTYNRQEEWTKLQLELTFSSFLGNNERYNQKLEKLESSFKPNDTVNQIIRKNAVVNSDAFDTIVKQAQKHQIVMINENHYYPNHRVFITDLLQRLHEAGYTYLALEALAEGQDSVLNLEATYPTTETGFYTSEQNYANLIREAKAIGFEFVAYDYPGHNNDREADQAENLYNKTFRINPDARVLVFAGIDHILEKPTKRGEKWMAAVFKEKYNIDPLTISQTHLNLYRSQLESRLSLISAGFFDSEKLNSVDYLVINNQEFDIDKKYAARYRYKNKSKSEVQVALFFGNEIENQYDYNLKIPYFTTLLKPGQKQKLPIPKGQEIHLYTFDKSGKTIDVRFAGKANKQTAD